MKDNPTFQIFQSKVQDLGTCDLRLDSGGLRLSEIVLEIHDGEDDDGEPTDEAPQQEDPHPEGEAATAEHGARSIQGDREKQAQEEEQTVGNPAAHLVGLDHELIEFRGSLTVLNGRRHVIDQRELGGKMTPLKGRVGIAHGPTNRDKAG